MLLWSLSTHLRKKKKKKKLARKLTLAPFLSDDIWLIFAQLYSQILVLKSGKVSFVMSGEGGHFETVSKATYSGPTTYELDCMSTEGNIACWNYFRNNIISGFHLRLASLLDVIDAKQVTVMMGDQKVKETLKCHRSLLEQVVKYRMA